LSHNPTFSVFAIATFVLCANLLFLWAYSGAVRGKTKTAVNKEDAEKSGASLADHNPPEVARVLRAHANAEASIYPFLFLGLIFVFLGGSDGTAKVIFGTFTLARLAHSAVYLAAKQPWRSLTFGVGGLATLVLLGQDIWMLAASGAGAAGAANAGIH
jgi:prostaglandin-E synthase 1